MPRNPDGSFTGAQCMTGVVDLYDIAGAIRLQLLDLIAAAKLRDSGGSGK